MIELRDLTVRSGSFQLAAVNLTVPSGGYGVLMGRSGAGKTTLLEGVCGLRPVTGGSVWLDGVDITQARVATRGIGYVPQDLALFPTMSVRRHLDFALRLRRAPEAEIGPQVATLAASLEIGHLLDRGVQDLSGGEARRVAVGRAVSFRPRLLLLDEPLAAVDEATRDRLCDLLRRVQREHGVTTLHVTHSRKEARQLAERLYVIDRGVVTTRPLESLEAAVGEAWPRGRPGRAARGSPPPPR
jgi:ABC-type sugar transport system ATPase subunit